MKHTKRYAVIFDKWSIYGTHQDMTEFDTLKEANEEIALIESMYADTPRPKYKYGRGENYSAWYYRKNSCLARSTNVCDYKWGEKYLGEAFWGYILVDFEDERVLKWGHDYLQKFDKWTDVRRLKDWLFRKPNEVPNGYKWDIGEYDGWLQFRWGDGKNSVKYGDEAIVNDKDGKKCTCVKHCNRIKKRKNFGKVYDENEEAELDKLNAKLLEEIKAVAS